MQPTNGTLRAIDSPGYDRIAVTICIEYILGAHLHTYETCLTPFPVNNYRVRTFLPFLFGFGFLNV